MTHEEAARYLDEFKDAFHGGDLETAMEMGAESLRRDAINMGETVTSGYIEPVGEDNNVPTVTATVVYPCEDAVSRQQALEAFGLSEKTRKYGGDHSGYDTIMLYEVQDVLENLPSVQPKFPPITITMNEPCMRG